MAKNLWADARSGLITAGEALRSDDPNSTSFDSYLDLVSEISTRHANYLLYLGSGVTKSAIQPEPLRGEPAFAAPDWSELLDRLFSTRVAGNPALRTEALQLWHQRAGIPIPSEPSLRTLEGKIDRLQLAWMIGQLYDRQGRDQRIRELVQPPSNADSQLVNELARLPTSVIVTTSYDDLVERALRRRKIADPEELDLSEEGPYSDYIAPHLSRVIPIYNDKSLSESFKEQGGLRIFYLHGSANHSDSQLILDRFDYAALLSRHGGTFDYVTYLLRSMPAIYIGFGLDDPSFNLMENRLYSYDSAVRPLSFAFVPMATPKEHVWWRERNLKLIEYGSYSALPQLIKTISDTRQFLCWAEPRRPMGSFRDSDRTDRYFSDSLSEYRRGRYLEATRSARAALASTLFWGSLRTRVPIDRSPRELLRLIDLRIRLGLCHYKQRNVRKEALDRAQVNIGEAKQLLAAVRPECREVEAYRCSLKVLEARSLYSRGEYAEAAEHYSSVVEDLRACVHESFEKPSELTYDQLKAIEVYSYAVCQSSRIRYQFRDFADSSWQDELSRLDQLVSRLDSFLHECPANPDTVDRRAKQYFGHSLATLRAIGRWFGARHCIGAVADVVPSSASRTSERGVLLERLGFALDRLEEVGPEGGLEAYALPKLIISKRWTALRSRYLARGYALRWLVNGAQFGGEAARDLARSYSFVADAMEDVQAPELMRSRVVTHLEAARVAVIAAYGALSQQEHRHEAALLFTLVNAMRQIEIAICLIKSGGEDVGEAAHYRDKTFLAGAAARLRCYVLLLSEAGGIPVSAFGDRTEIGEIVAMDSDYLPEECRAECERHQRFEVREVVALYASFDTARMRSRIQRFLTEFKRIETELIGQD